MLDAEKPGADSEAATTPTDSEAATTPAEAEAAGTPPDAEAAVAPADAEAAERIRQALRSVTDPELGINIVDLGLVYDVEVAGDSARVTMTLTSPGCPAGGQILTGAKAAAESVDGVSEAEVELVWKPFWTPERIDAKVRAMLGF